MITLDISFSYFFCSNNIVNDVQSNIINIIGNVKRELGMEFKALLYMYSTSRRSFIPGEREIYWDLFVDVDIKEFDFFSIYCMNKEF